MDTAVSYIPGYALGDTQPSCTLICQLVSDGRYTECGTVPLGASFAEISAEEHRIALILSGVPSMKAAIIARLEK